MSNIHETIHIGNLTLNNRLVMPPMASEKAQEGLVGPEHVDFFRERNTGESVGLVIVEHSYVSPEGKASPYQLSASRDEDISGLAQLAQAVHEGGGKVFLQLNHAGAATHPVITGLPPVGPSNACLPPDYRKGEKVFGISRALTLPGIELVVQDFADAAGRAVKAGFDGVEIHSAHGYLLNQFLSPLTNHREDEYGGNFEGRIRLHRDIISAVKAAVPAGFPVALRLGACDYMEGGLTKKEGVRAAMAFEELGVDLLDISGGFCRYTHPQSTNPGYFRELTEAIKMMVSIPVLLTGGITEGSQAQELLQEEAADLIGVGRALLKDPLWAQKALQV